MNSDSLHSRADFERTLSNYNLSLDGTVPTLRKRLSQHLGQLEARVTKNVLQTDAPLSKPAALCMVSEDLLVSADDGHRAIYQIQLKRDGVIINGKLRKLIKSRGCLSPGVDGNVLVLQFFTSQRQRIPSVHGNQ